MGWASGGEVFDPVARKMREMACTDEQVTEVLAILIDGLQERGWDTEDESLGEFQDDAAITEAFRRHQIVLRCHEEFDADGEFTECERERGDLGHQDGQHEDYLGRKAPVASAT
jgi:hypothetical protein